MAGVDRVGIPLFTQAIKPKEAAMTSFRYNHHPSLFVGPLSKTQVLVLDGMATGDDQRAIANRLNFSRGYISACMSGAVAKLNVRSSWEAVALWTRAKAYIDAAKILERSITKGPGEMVDEDPVNNVLLGLASILRERAAAIIPA